MKGLLNVIGQLRAPKGQFNSFGKYHYRSCEDILEALKPLLISEGLAMTISDEVVLIGDRYYIKATVTVFDGESSSSVSAFAREPLDKKGMDDSQITGTASSYARKYALNGMFLIDDNKDADSLKLPGSTPPTPPAAKSREAEPATDEQYAKLRELRDAYGEKWSPQRIAWFGSMMENGCTKDAANKAIAAFSAEAKK